MFWARKLLGAALMPLSLSLELLLLGLFLCWCSRRQRWGKMLLTLGTLFLLLCSTNFVADRVLIPLERQYPPVNLETLKTQARDRPLQWVVVLGGGQGDDPRLPASSRLSGASLARLIEGIRIYRALPGAKLLLSGGPVFSRASEAETMAAAARALGVSPGDIAVEADSMDTMGQARLIRARLGTGDFILVTSGAHLPRAMALFARQGLHPLPAPAGPLVNAAPVLAPTSLLPNVGALGRVTTAWYEYLGLLWAKLGGKI